MSFKVWFFVFAIPFVLFSCDSDDSSMEEEPDPTYSVNLKVRLQYNGQDVEFFKDYTNTQGDTFSFSTFKFYLSDIRLTKNNDTYVSGDEIALFDLNDKNPDGIQNTVNMQADLGTYKNISFGLGVKSELNDVDPANYELDHPLGLNSLMYWTWATQYKFVMSEGEVNNDGWLIHTGTNDLYRADITIDKSFVVDQVNEPVEIIINFNKVLDGVTVIDLDNNGVSHTTDNFDLAEDLTNNLVEAFE